MNIDELTSLGLTKNEAEIYLILAKFYEIDAKSIIQETKFHKKIVYDNLHRLIDKGFVTSVIKDKRNFFSLASPNMLSIYIEEQEKELQRKKKIANKIKEEVDSMKESLKENKQDATAYKGKNAVISFYKETLELGDYYVLGAPKESVEIMGDLFWDNYHLKRKNNKQKVHLLLNQSLRSWGKQQKDSCTEIRYFDRDFEPKTETHIQEDMVAFIVWEREPIVFKIKSATTANSYKKYFVKMWKIAKK